MPASTYFRKFAAVMGAFATSTSISIVPSAVSMTNVASFGSATGCGGRLRQDHVRRALHDAIPDLRLRS